MSKIKCIYKQCNGRNCLDCEEAADRKKKDAPKPTK